MVNTSSPLYMSEEEREKAKSKIDQIVYQLNVYGATFWPPLVNNVGSFDYVVQFKLGIARIIVYLSLKDWQVDSDVVITNMGTIPSDERSKGYGSEVIGYLIAWAAKNGFNEIRATQISNPRSDKFWRKNGFIIVPSPNPCGDLIYPIPTKAV